MKPLTCLSIFLLFCACRGTGIKHTDTIRETITKIEVPQPEPEKEEPPSTHVRADSAIEGNVPDAPDDLEIKNDVDWPHILDNGVTVRGFVLNKSGTRSYKDVVIQIGYYTKTGTLLTTEYFTQYDYFPPGCLKRFSCKGSDIDNIAYTAVIVKSAVSY